MSVQLAGAPEPVSVHGRIRRVTLVINSMWNGGAERVMAIMANHWAAQGWVVALITIANRSPHDYELDARVNRVALNVSRPSYGPIGGALNNARRLLALRKAIAGTRPDVVISFMVTPNILTLLATRLMGIPVVVSERSLPSRSTRGPVWRALRASTYPLAQLLVVQSEAAKSYFGRHIRSKVIANPVRGIEHRGPVAHHDEDAPYILAMGRLEDVKRCDHIVRAFAVISADFPKWQLRLVGDGSRRGDLERLAADLNITGRVQFTGYVSDTVPHLQGAGLFVMASQYEGLPNAMLEAMACGLPVISYDCPGGIREIIRHDVDGVLVPSGDVNDLARAMAELLAAPDRRARIGNAAMAVQKRFSAARIMATWEQEIEKLVDGGGRHDA